MPFDGIVAKCVTLELNNILSGGRIDKIYQPAVDKAVIHVYSNGRNYKLLASANPSCPGIYITEESGSNPTSPLMFCMLLRKHLSGGRIIEFVFNDYERIIDMLVDTINEMGDRVTKKLVVEIMGKHSNVILVDEKDRIIDSIRHVDSEVSSVREIMPARPYIRPPAQDKENPETLDVGSYIRNAKAGAKTGNKSIRNYILGGIRGFSPHVCTEICRIAGIDEDTPVNILTGEETEKLEQALRTVIECIKNNNFSPWVSYDNEGKPLDFHCLKPFSPVSNNTCQVSHDNCQAYHEDGRGSHDNCRVSHDTGRGSHDNLPDSRDTGRGSHDNFTFSHTEIITHESISKAIDTFYLYRNLTDKVNSQKSSIMKKVRNELRKCQKKCEIHQKSLAESADSEKMKLYGELLTANIHSIPPFSEKVSLLNYYSDDGAYIEIPLDRNLSPQENAQRYYKKYAVYKRTYSHASRQLQKTLKDMEYLENVLLYLENCKSLPELDEIREELAEQGIISDSAKISRKKDAPSRPYHYVSSDGFDIYVGRNNKQNDVLTQQSSPNDMWFHTRNIPGSHVIVRSGGRDIPDRTLREAAILSAVHSKARMSTKVPVDYTLVKYVRKPKGSRPGMVLYDNFKTLIADADESVRERLAIRESQ